MSNIYNSAQELIGNTPIIRLHNIEKKYDVKAKILAKLEFFNIAGSVKDRVGKAIIEDAEEKGILKEGSVIIEPTSGNTGIGIAAMAAVKGYKAVIVMPETMSDERKKLMKAHGAELVMTDGKLGMAGAIAKANELAKEIPSSFIAGQFKNPANVKVHLDTTGPEIYNDTDGKVDIFVAGIGTGGTITGVGQYLKSKNKKIEVIGVEPENSPYLTKGIAGKHAIQGIGAGFAPQVLNREFVDRVVTVSDDNAINTARYMGIDEGFLIGISSGAALYTAIELGKKDENKDKTIVVLFPDSGSKYLSTELYNF